MRAYHYDHVHLRSQNPDATARFFETMFNAEVTRSVYPPGTLYPGQMRVTMRVGGQKVLIAPTHPHDATAGAPQFPYLAIYEIETDNIGAVLADLNKDMAAGRISLTDAVAAESWGAVFEERGPAVRQQS